MKNNLIILPAVLGLTLVSLPAQSWTSPVPMPERPQGDLRVQLDADSPLDSLERHLVHASFDQRGELAKAFEQVYLSVRQQISRLGAQGVDLNDEARASLNDANDFGRQAFRNLSLTTEETFHTSQHNALMALRKIRGTLENLHLTASDDQF